MSKISTAIRLFVKDQPRFWAEITKSLGFLFPDELYLKILYRLELGHKLNLENPQFYTEKLQWLKLYDRKNSYINIVDKYEVKRIVQNIIGSEYIIPTIGVWDSPKDITWDALPERFVLKTTFGGGSDGVFICKHKDFHEIEKIKKGIKKSMRTNPYQRLREWPNKMVPKRIIAEEFLDDETGDLRDYKFYCFNGVPKVLLIASNRYTSHNFDYFDMDFNRLPITSAMGPNNPEIASKPDCFEKMKSIAAQLSANYSHIRIDLYYCNKQIYFGEMTLYDSSGFDDLSSEEWNHRFGDWITLPTKR